jgi:MFS transporter, ACS family, hexuronate transporter
VKGARTALAVAVVVQTTISIAEMGVPTLAPFFASTFALSAGQVGLLVSSLGVGRTFGALPAGLLVDRIGETTVMVVAGVVSAGLFALAGLAPAWWGVAAALAVAGVFTGSAGPAGTKFIIGAFPPTRRGLPMGVRQSAIPLGGLLAAVALPLLAHHHSLRAALLACGGALAAGGVCALVGMPALPGERGAAPGGPSGFALVRADRDIRLAVAWGMLFIGGQYAIVSYLILDLTAGSGVSLTLATALLAVAQVGGLVGRVLWGLVSDRRFDGRRKPLLQGMTAGGLVCVLVLAAAPGHEPAAVLVLVCLVAGGTLIAWQGMWNALLSELAPAHAVGTAIGFGLMFTNVAIVFWPPVFGWIADRSGSYRVSWLVLAAALAASALLLAAVGERASVPDPGAVA